MKVGVGRDDVVTTRQREAQSNGGALAPIDGLANEEGVGQVPVDLVGDTRGVVARSVVDDDDLGRVGAHGLERRAQSLEAGAESRRFVVRRDHERGRYGHALQPKGQGRAAP